MSFYHAFLIFLLAIAATCVQAQETSAQHCCDIKTDSVVTLKRLVLPFAKQPQRVTVGVKNGYAILDGDIVLGRLKDLVAQSEAESGVAIDGSASRWPKSVIPYTISSSFSETYKNTILKAINYVDAQTNLCFVARKEETDYVTFQPGEGCSSSIGKVGGQQFISLLSTGCDVGRVVHEICHAAGLYHEQSRQDRDSFLIVHWDNIQADKKHNFDQHIIGATDYGAYDYYAIMHYPSTAFAIDATKNTLTPRKTLPNAHGVVPIDLPISGTVGMGQRLGLTQGEIATINALYPTACSNCQPPAWIVVDGETWHWENVPNDGFVFEIRVKGSGDWETFEVSGNSKYYDVSISTFTTFEVRVKTKCQNSDDYSDYSKVFEFYYTVSDCYPPGWLNFSNITSNSATATWGSVFGITKYFLFHKKLTETTWQKNVINNATQFDFTGLEANTDYNVAVSSVCVENGVEEEGYALFTYLKTTVVCNAPPPPTATNVQATSATINWAAVAGISTYKLEIKRVTDATWTNLGNFSGTSRNVTNLQAATTYQVRLSLVCATNATSLPSAMAIFLTGACISPSTPTVSNVQNNGAVLSWSAVTGVSSYKVEIKRSTDAAWTNLGNGSGTSRTLTNLQSSTSYQARVSSVCSSASTSQPSGIVSFATGQCVAPSTLSIGNIYVSSATASWSTITGVTTYKLEIKRSVDAIWTNLGNINGSVQTITNLQSATAYQVRVSSVCSSTSTSTSNPSNIKTFTTGQCTAPNAPVASNILSSSATVSWTSISGVSSYQLELKRSADATWTNMGSATGNLRTLTNLLPATTYQVRVSSVCSSASTSPPSTIGTFTTGQCLAPNPPVASNISPTSATVSWTSVGGVSSYKLELKRSVDATWTNLGNAAGNSRALTNLLPSTIYHVRVSSVCSGASTSNPSNITVFTTLAPSNYDNPCSALTFTPLNICSQVTMTNVGASATTTPVVPPTACGVTNIRDVWFRCQAPSTGKVNIYTFPGSLTDGVIGLYFGNNCGALSYYGCWDTNGADEMPDIWASAAVGNWIYLRYWGYDGLVGTFSACVQIAPNGHTDQWPNLPAAGLIEKHVGLDAEPRMAEIQSMDIERENTRPTVGQGILRISPNPAREHLTFHTDQLENIHQVQVLGADGRLVLSQHLSSNVPNYWLDVQALPTGIYVLKASLENGGIVTGRFVKE